MKTENKSPFSNSKKKYVKISAEEQKETQSPSDRRIVHGLHIETGHSFAFGFSRGKTYSHPFAGIGKGSPVKACRAGASGEQVARRRFIEFFSVIVSANFAGLKSVNCLSATHFFRSVIALPLNRGAD